MLVADPEPVTAPTEVAVLRPARTTTERELDRQRVRAGRRGLSAALALAPLRLRSLGSEQAARDGLRYQPVIWTVIAIVAVAFYLPGRDDPGANAFAASPSATTPFVPTSTPPPITAPTTTTPVATSPPPTLPPLRPVITSSPAAVPVPTTAVAPPVTTVTTTTAPAPVPLSIVASGWASSTGAPIGVSPVPDGTLPVANRLGGVDKVSFVRLAGTATSLSIAEDPDGAQEALGPAAVKLCKIEDADWQEGPGQSMDAAPTWSDTCVGGVEVDNTWTFDLSGLGDPASRNGFAFVPGDSAPADFQVTYEL